MKQSNSVKPQPPMDHVSRTLYIPLYGKAWVSRRGLLLRDEKAEEIWAAEGFPLKGKAGSKWLAYTMGMRSTVFDQWTRQQMAQLPDAVVLHVGCGMDSRCLRLEQQERLWFDVDFPEVIAERKRYFTETETCRMLGADIREETWLERIPGGQPAIIVMEGVSMYLQPEALNELLKRWKAYFGEIRILMDVYTVFGAKASKYKNPINEVGVTKVFGVDDPGEPARGTGIRFVQEHTMTPDWLIQHLPKGEQGFFRHMFAGRMAKKIYRLYEYR